jgi:predicted CoA-binding protein
MPLESDEALRDLLARVRSIAVVGIKAGADDDAFRVPLHMQACGWRILPVSPRLHEVLGEPCVPNLAQVAEPIDLVNVFRATENVPAHVDEILALRPRPLGVWLQLGIRHDTAAARLEEAGIAVVQDRCLMLDQRRLGVRPAFLGAAT